MAIRKNQLPMSAQVNFELLGKVDQAEILNCRTIEDAVALINQKDKKICLRSGEYEPKLQVSGSSVKYRTKNLFTETFDEQDVKDFMAIAEVPATTGDGILSDELRKKADTMEKEGKSPLQCMVYATKNNERDFYGNRKRVGIWTQMIAEIVGRNSERYIPSINHMLVNWGMWKFQTLLLLQVCGRVEQNEGLDKVLRDLYTDHEDDEVRYEVMKRLLRGRNAENYRSAFAMLRKGDFIGTYSDQKYFGALRKKVENATPEEREELYAAFRGTQGFTGAKKKKIEELFIEEESEIVRKINESSQMQKDAVLKEVYNKINGSQKNYRELTEEVRKIKKYRPEIQSMFMQRLDKGGIGLEGIKTCGLAIGNLDSEGKALPFLKDQMSMCMNESEKVMLAYVLAVFSDEYIDNFVENVLTYDGGNRSLLDSVRKLNGPGKSQIVGQCLYANCVKIKDKYGFGSDQFRIALRNMGEFLQASNTSAAYDARFDQLLFGYLGYDQEEGAFDNKKCTAGNMTRVLGILNDVMDRKNYERRYMKFMGDLYAFCKERNVNLAEKINDAVEGLTGEGFPKI